MQVIIAPCSGRKRDGGQSAPVSFTRSALGTKYWNDLCHARSALGSRLGLEPGPDLGNAVSSSIPLAPAWQRYDGNLYRKAELSEADIQQNGVVLLIVSALFGVITAADTIRNYNLAMTDRLSDGTKVNKFWHNRGLSSIVADLLGNLGARHVDDLLSGSYRGAVKGLDMMVPPGCDYRVHTYPGLGTGSDYHRGMDLRKLVAVESSRG
jgi:hypothetical protein